jgi:hypothetical protein
MKTPGLSDPVSGMNAIGDVLILRNMLAPGGENWVDPFRLIRMGPDVMLLMEPLSRKFIDRSYGFLIFIICIYYRGGANYFKFKVLCLRFKYKK